MLLLTLFIAPTLAQDAPSFASGETPTLNAQSFRPSLDATTMLRTTDSALLRNKTFFGRALLQYARDPLVYYPFDYETTGEVQEIVSGLTELDLAGGYTFGAVRAGVLVPVYLRGTGPDTAETGLGDVMVDVKVRALNREDHPIGLGFSGRVGLPTATTSLPLSTGGLLYEAEIIADAAVGDATLALNLGQRGQPQVDLEGATWGSQLYANLGGSYAFSERAGAALELSSSFTEADFGNSAVMPIEAILSGWRRVGDENSALVVRGGLGLGVTQAVSAPAWRALLSLTWDPKPGQDRDADGILDELDTCPDVPEDMDTVVDTDGCPETTHVIVKVVDQFGDPVPTARWTEADRSGAPGDALELNAGTFNFSATADGYTAGTTSLMVTDAASAEVVVVTPMILGSLTVTAKDNLGNTVPNANWRLVGAPGTEPHPAGIAVPLRPGDYNLRAEADGYRPVTRSATVVREKEALVIFEMELAKAVVTASKIEIKDKVYFETDKAIIKTESYGLLDEVAEIINSHPELTKIRIEGHTDSRGNDAYNKDLSQRRADSVRVYLEGKGVAAARLESVGYGEEKPLKAERNDTDRALNRRVEFFVLDRSDGAIKAPVQEIKLPQDQPKVDH